MLRMRTLSAQGAASRQHADSGNRATPSHPQQLTLLLFLLLGCALRRCLAALPLAALLLIAAILGLCAGGLGCRAAASRRRRRPIGCRPVGRFIAPVGRCRLLLQPLELRLAQLARGSLLPPLLLLLARSWRLRHAHRLHLRHRCCWGAAIGCCTCATRQTTANAHQLRYPGDARAVTDEFV